MSKQEKEIWLDDAQWEGMMEGKHELEWLLDEVDEDIKYCKRSMNRYGEYDEYELSKLNKRRNSIIRDLDELDRKMLHIHHMDELEDREVIDPEEIDRMVEEYENPMLAKELFDIDQEKELYNKMIEEMVNQYEDTSKEVDMIEEIDKLERKYSEKQEVNPLEMLKDIQKVRVMLHEAEKMILKYQGKNIEVFRENIIKPLMILRKRLQDQCENDIQWNLIYSWVGKK